MQRNVARENGAAYTVLGRSSSERQVDVLAESEAWPMPMRCSCFYRPFDLGLCCYIFCLAPCAVAEMSEKSRWWPKLLHSRYVWRTVLLCLLERHLRSDNIFVVARSIWSAQSACSLRAHLCIPFLLHPSPQCIQNQIRPSSRRTMLRFIVDHVPTLHSLLTVRCLPAGVLSQASKEQRS